MSLGSLYLNALEVRLITAAIEAMLGHLPTGEDVPAEDKLDAERDRVTFIDLRAKLERHAEKLPDGERGTGRGRPYRARTIT